MELIFLTGFLGFIFYVVIMLPFYFLKIVISIIKEILYFKKVEAIKYEIKKNNNVEYLYKE
jgi:hypothetical protein